MIFIMDHEVTVFEYLEFLNADSIQSTGKKNDVTFIDLEDKDCPIMFQDDKFVFQKTSNIKKDYCPIVEISNYGAKAFAWNLE